MANLKISELTTATNPSVSDVLPIVNQASTKKITAASLLANTLSASTMALSGAVVYKNVQLYNPELSIGASDIQKNFNNVFLHAGNGQIAIGDCETGKTFRRGTAIGGYRSVQNGNIFIGGAAGTGVSRGTYGGQPFRNIAIGAKAGCCLGGDDDATCSGRTRYNRYNTLIGNYAGASLCADTNYAAQKNIVIGDKSFQSAANIVTNSISIGYAAGKYLAKSRNNTFIGYRAAAAFSMSGDAYPKFNVVLGACAGQALKCISSNNVMVGYLATVGSMNASCTINSSVAIGSQTCVVKSNAVAIGAAAFAYMERDIVIGWGSRSRYSGGNQIVIGAGNQFTGQSVGSNLSGAIVLGSCNQNISTTFVLGSPVFPLSARIDTTLTGQVSSLFVTINGTNRRIPILS